MDWAAARAHWPNADASRFVETRAHRWHIQRAGAGPGVLLLHGAGASTHSWRGMVPLLARDAEVFALDLPGHGFTRRQGFSRSRLPEMAADIADLLAVEGFDPALIVGHSAGAAIALQMVRDRPQIGVLGLNPALVPFRGLAGLLFPPLAKLLALNPFSAPFFARTAGSERQVRTLLETTGSAIDDEGLRLYRMLIGSPKHLDGVLRMMARWDLGPLLRALPHIAAPVTLAVGLADGTVPPEETRTQAARLPNATLLEIPGLGHLMHEEAPERFAALALDHLPQSVVR